MFADITPRFTAVQNAWKCYCFDVLCGVDVIISILEQKNSGDSRNYCDNNFVMNFISIFVAN